MSATDEFVEKYQMDFDDPKLQLRCDVCNKLLNIHTPPDEADFITFWGNVHVGFYRNFSGLIGDNLDKDLKVFRVSAFHKSCLEVNRLIGE